VPACLLKGSKRRNSKEGDCRVWWLARAAEHEIGSCSSTTATARGKVEDVCKRRLNQRVAAVNRKIIVYFSVVPRQLLLKTQVRKRSKRPNTIAILRSRLKLRNLLFLLFDYPRKPSESTLSQHSKYCRSYHSDASNRKSTRGSPPA